MWESDSYKIGFTVGFIILLYNYIFVVLAFGEGKFLIGFGASIRGVGHFATIENREYSEWMSFRIEDVCV
jgi:hypothetical protein